ncbi:MAG: lipopolysaccharide biosynthesis protein [Myxococcales bacterium]|jgi:O-antigen/teichoic acid export membrane protein
MSEAAKPAATEPQSRPARSLMARARPLVVARTASAAISFVIPLALVRVFLPEDYGAYKQLILIAQTLYYLLPFGMSQSLYYFIPRSREPRPYLVQVLAYLAAAGALAMAALLLGGALIARGLNNPALVGYLPYLSVYVFGLIGSIPLEIALTAQGRAGRAAVAYVVSDLAKAAAMTLPGLIGFGLEGVVQGMALFALLRLLACWGLHLRASPGPMFQRSALKAQLKFALPFGAAVALAVPQQAFHQWVVSSNLSPALFAVYAVGIFQVPLFDLLYAPTSEILMVRIAELEREGRVREAAAVFREAVLKLSYAFVPLTLLLMAAAPEVIGALFTRRYIEAAPIFRVAVAAGLLACLPIEGALRARGQTRHIFLSFALKAAVTVPLALFGVARFGMLGGIGSWLAAEVIGKLALFARLPSALGARARDLLPWRGLLRPALAATAALVGVYGVRALAPADLNLFVVLGLASMAYGALYVGALALMGGRAKVGRDARESKVESRESTTPASPGT